MHNTTLVCAIDPDFSYRLEKFTFEFRGRVNYVQDFSFNFKWGFICIFVFLKFLSKYLLPTKRHILYPGDCRHHQVPAFLFSISLYYVNELVMVFSIKMHWQWRNLNVTDRIRLFCILFLEKGSQQIANW